jgi:two-component system chemotaxis sensor kinase CheA
MWLRRCHARPEAPVNDDLLEQFIAEARDLLVEAGEDLLALERAPTDKARINRLFRSVHTLKGSSCLFDMPGLTQVLHAGEDLFEAVRERGLALTPEMVDAMLSALDQTGKWIDVLEQTEALPADAGPIASAMAAALRAHFQPTATAGAKVKASEAVATGTAPPALATWFPPATVAACAALSGDLHLISYQPGESCFFKGEDPLYLALNIPGLAALALEPRVAWNGLDQFDPFHCNLRFHAISTADAAELGAKFRYVTADVTLTRFAANALQDNAQSDLPPIVRDLLRIQDEMLRAEAPAEEMAGRLAAAAAVARHALIACGQDPNLDATTPETLCQALATRLAGPEPAVSATAAANEHEKPATVDQGAVAGRRVLRVDQEKIDVLMNLVGELVVAKNSLPFLSRRADEHFGARALAREIKDEYGIIDRITQELQGAVMAVRMMPVGQVFQRFPRLVRDLARKLGKQVELVIGGEETEADKNIIESLFDPLMHMVRNSLDHGIEPPAERLAAGKPETATLRLLARQDGDQVVIEIIDDGRGINPTFIKQKAYERGLIDEHRLSIIDDQDAQMLIFAAGFSTAATISDVSGRGVGMDVVRDAVEQAGGKIALASTFGQGTTLRLSLPLSMAVTRVMTVMQDGRLFGIPMDMVLETVKLPRADVTRIKTAEAFLLRDSIVPLRHLATLLELPPASPQPDEISVLVARAAGQIFGLGISSFGEVMEVILKPMDGILSRITGYSGSCLLGDGKVMLVLDLKALLS